MGKEKKASSLTTLHAHGCIEPPIGNSTHGVVSILENTRLRAVVNHREMVYLVLGARPALVVLVRDTRVGGVELIENALRRVRGAVVAQVLEQGRDGVVGDVGGRESHGLVLRGAVQDGDEAVGAGVRGCVGFRVDSHLEGQVDFAVAVVLVAGGGIAEVTGGGRCQDQV